MKHTKTYSLKNETIKKLKELSFKLDKPMSFLIDDAIELLYKKEK